MNRKKRVLFATALSGQAIPYLLRDDFTDTVAAGSVNNTTATPTGQTRTVTDTNSKWSVGGGVLDVATGGAVGDIISYPQLSRLAGRALIICSSITAPTVRTGWDEFGDSFVFSNVLIASVNNTNVTVGGNLVPGETLYTAIIMRAAGMLYLVKGGAYTNWTLVWTSIVSSAARTPNTTQRLTTAVFTTDFIRVPVTAVSFAPLASDSFNRTNGAIGTADGAGTEETAPTATWTGSTYTISTNKAINTPTQGSELVTNGTFDSDINGWSQVGLETFEWSAGALHIVETGTSFSYAYQAGLFTLGNWYIIGYNLTKNSGANLLVQENASVQIAAYSASSGAAMKTIRSTVGGSFAFKVNGGAADWAIDDVSVKALTLSTLFSSVSVSSQNVLCSADLVVTTGTQAGVVVCLDSTSSPANFMIAYHDGTNAVLEKCVGGTYTTLVSAAATYSAGATLTVIKDGNSVSLYYNNALIGTTQTVSDAGIVSNTKHGLFSTYSANTMDNFRVWDRKSSYSTLDRFIR